MPKKPCLASECGAPGKKSALKAAEKQAARAAGMAGAPEQDDEDARAARRAAKKAARIAAEAVQADDEAATKETRRAAKLAAKEELADAEAGAAAPDEAAAKEARRAAKLAAKEAAAKADAEAADAEAARAARKAAKRAARAAAAAEGAEAPEEGDPPRKRKEAYSGDAEQHNKRKTPAVEDSLQDDGSSAPSSKSRKLRSSTDAPRASEPQGAKAFREQHQIIVGADCPPPFETFEAVKKPFGESLTKALLDQGYKAPTPIQAQAWPIALRGEDLVAVAKTGSGKTCGFILPVLARIAERGPAPAPSRWGSQPAHPSALVLAPTRELAQQIASEAEKFAKAAKARVVSIYGGVPKGDQVRELRQGCDILIATPGRLLDLAGGDPQRGIKPVVALETVTYLVLDEADRMLDMGFEPDIRSIVEKCPKTGKPEEGGGATGLLAASMRQTLFFTATWPKAVQATAASLTASDAVQVRIGQGSDGETLTANPNVTQSVKVLREEDKVSKLKEVIADELGNGETAIVFAAQKHVCDHLVGELQSAGLGIWCRTIHSGKDQWDRDAALAKFRSLTTGEGSKDVRGVLVATDVASRGLDIPGVALVVVYDFGRALHSSQNGGVEAYVHRIGRTGRAGKKGRAVTFFTEQDLGACELIELLRGAGQEVPQALVELAESESNERWVKDSKKSYYRRGRGRGGSKGGGKGRGKGGGKGASRGRGGGGGRGGRGR